MLATLRLEPPVCHLSGNPPFKIVIEFTTNSEEVVTVDKSRTPLSTFQYHFHGPGELIHCTDCDSGERVEWPYAVGCFGSDPHPDFPDDSDFVEIRADKPWRFEYVLEEESPINVGGLEYLEAGKTYRATFPKNFIKGFSNWRYGRKEELLEGTLEEKKQRWNNESSGRKLAKLKFVGGPVEFNVVE
jgi:hypothetical protein